MVIEITKQSELYDIAKGLFAWDKPFYDKQNTKELEELLGVKIEKNLCLEPSILMLETIPEGTESQFCKNRVQGFYKARKNSNLNKKYTEWIKSKGIKKVNDYSLSFRLPCRHQLSEYHKCFDRYFISTKILDEDQVKSFEAVEGLKFIDESDFLRLKADYKDHLKENGKR